VTDRQKPSLAGWTALVTGGGSGIGLGCARRLAADGASVTLCGRSAERLAAAAEAVRAVAAPGADVQAVPTDVTDEEQVRAAVAAATGFGPGPDVSADDRGDGAGGARGDRAGRDGDDRLDAVVVSAGGSETIGPLTQTDAGAWRRTLDLNVTGAMLTIKAAPRSWRRRAAARSSPSRRSPRRSPTGGSGRTGRRRRRSTTSAG